MNRLIALGEVLEDYVPDNNGYKKLVGGAPLNFLSMASEFNVDSYFISCLSNDEGSKRALSMMNKEKVHTEYIKFDYSTVLCHSEVTVDKKTGEREFYFYKDNASFLSLNENDIKEDYFNNNDVFHFGTVCLLNESIYKAQKKALEYALYKNCFISFDPNFRPTLFKEEKQKEFVFDFLPFVNLLKLGIDELKILTNGSIDQLFDNFNNLKLIFLTKGENGIDLCFRNKKIIHVDSIKVSKVIDTVGCGDCSYGAFISLFMNNNEIDKNNIDKLDKKIYLNALNRASKVGSLLCLQQGALPVPKIK